MDKIQAFRKVGAPTDTKTQNVMELAKSTNNIYATTVAIAQRADQISEELKHELSDKLLAFTYTVEDNPEKEEFRNEEQIDLSRQYECLPKPVLLALQEFLNNRLTITELSEEEAKQAAETAKTPGREA
jgi:hypothetical protein